MCMTDDENDCEQNYSGNVPGTPGALAPGTNAGAAAKRSSGKICPKCLIFWALVFVVALAVVFKKK